MVQQQKKEKEKQQLSTYTQLNDLHHIMPRAARLFFVPALPVFLLTG